MEADQEAQLAFDRSPYTYDSDSDDEDTFTPPKIIKPNPLVDFFKRHCGQSNLTMIESTAYFESYYHVLNKLQWMGSWNSMPLSEYFIGNKRDQISLPQYLEEA